MSDKIQGPEFMILLEYSQQEFLGAPLTTMVHARFPRPLTVFIKTAALTSNVPESVVIRYAVQKWAESQGFNATCV